MADEQNEFLLNMNSFKVPNAPSFILAIEIICISVPLFRMNSVMAVSESGSMKNKMIFINKCCNLPSRSRGGSGAVAGLWRDSIMEFLPLNVDVCNKGDLLDEYH
jgi:hypothetical protein